MKKLLSQLAKVAFLAIVFGAISVYAAGFVGPTGTPAATNASLPLNVSLNDQFKQGGIGISSLLIGPGGSTPGATNASILGSVRIGTGTVASGSGWLQANTKIGVGTSVVMNSVPVNGITALGTITGSALWGANSVTAGLNGFLNPPTAAGVGAPGAVIADKFCFSGINGSCTTTWGGGGTTLTGAINNTIRFSAPNTPVAATNFTNDGTNLALNGGLLTINQSSSNSDVIYLNAGLFAPHAIVVTNKSDIRFWNASGSRNASLIAYDLTATNLANTTNQYICADTEGKLTLCGGGPVTSGPTVVLTVDRSVVSSSESYSISSPIVLSWTTTNITSGSCSASGDWSGSKAIAGGSSSVTINQFGEHTFSISCVNQSGMSTPTSTVTVVASGSKTFIANMSLWNPATNFNVSRVTQYAVQAVGGGGGGAIEGCTAPSDCVVSSGDAGGQTNVSWVSSGTTTIFSAQGGGGGDEFSDGTPGNGFATGGATVFSGSQKNPGINITLSGVTYGKGGNGVNDATVGLSLRVLHTGGGASGIEKLINFAPGPTGQFQNITIGSVRGLRGETKGATRISWQ